jgi:hypothetical protein
MRAACSPFLTAEFSPLAYRLQRGLFSEANEVYKRFELHRSRVAAITPAQLEQQRAQNAALYLSFPLQADAVLHVTDMASLAAAAQLLTVSLREDTPPGSTYLKPVSVQELGEAPGEDAAARSARMLQLCGRYRCVVGLDCEWSFSMDPRAGQRGCSIVQVGHALDEDVHFLLTNSRWALSQIATADRVLILYLRRLLQPSQLELRELTRRFLQNLFSDESILKAGWDFGNQDLKMLRNNAGGKLSICCSGSLRRRTHTVSLLVHQTLP